MSIQLHRCERSLGKTLNSVISFGNLIAAIHYLNPPNENSMLSSPLGCDFQYLLETTESLT